MAAWSAMFLNALRAGYVPAGFAVETWDNANGQGVGVPGKVFSSMPVPGALEWLDPLSVEVGAQQLSLPSWSYTGSSWSFTLVTDDPLTVAQVLRRGTLVSLRVGLPGWLWPQWEVVQSGQVQQITWTRRGIVVEVWDLIAALRSRVDGNAQWCDLFYQLPSSTTVDGSYSPGDSTFDVADASILHRKTGGTGLVRVEPSGGTPFYLSYTGITGNTITGVSAAALYGTTAASGPHGTPVYDIGYLVGRPDVLAAQLLISTGSGTNGTYDVLPRSWGWALPEAMVDTWGAVVDHGNAILDPASGVYQWEVRVEDAQTDGLGWLTGLLGEVGIAIVQRQGQITLRIAQDVDSPGVPPVCEIADGDLLTETDGFEDPSVEWWSQDAEQEYTVLTVSGDGTQSTLYGSYPGSFPTLGSTQTIDLTDRLWSNVSVCCDLEVGRLWPTYHRVAEVLHVYLSTCWWAQLAVGDLVRVSLDRLHGRLLSTSTGYSQRTAQVVYVRPDWLRGATELRLAVRAIDDADEFRV